MWTLAFAIYAGCKWLTWWSASGHRASAGRQLGYLYAWPGLDASAFLNNPSRSIPQPRLGEWVLALAKTGVGFSILFGVTRLLPFDEPYLAGWVGMIGMVLILHFGVFHLLSCAWRNAGIDARPLMNRPLASTSLSEFWGKRWNVAFRDITYRFLFRPLTARVGGRWAIALGFLVSGLIHDLVISVPAGGGYGLPTAYFLLQGVGVFVERSRLGVRIGLSTRWRGRLFAGVVVIAPACMLFHPPFVERVILPFMRDIGALP